MRLDYDRGVQQLVKRRRRLAREISHPCDCFILIAPETTLRRPAR